MITADTAEKIFKTMEKLENIYLYREHPEIISHISMSAVSKGGEEIFVAHIPLNTPTITDIFARIADELRTKHENYLAELNYLAVQEAQDEKNGVKNQSDKTEETQNESSN